MPISLIKTGESAIIELTINSIQQNHKLYPEDFFCSQLKELSKKNIDINKIRESFLSVIEWSILEPSRDNQYKINDFLDLPSIRNDISLQRKIINSAYNLE
jgi:hypothetical protein